MLKSESAQRLKSRNMKQCFSNTGNKKCRYDKTYKRFSEFVGSLEKAAYITGAVLDRVLGQKVRPGDVVILDSPYKLEPFTVKTNTAEDRRLFVNGETGEWMVAHGVKCVGFGDGVSIENRNEDVKPFHDVCMAKNITFLEVLKNLDELRQETFFISFAPLYIKGLDSCPVRVYAIEGLDGY